MKLLGGILIICASICASFFYEKRLKHAIISHVELTELIRHIEVQIDYFSKPINDIFKDYDTNSLFIKDLINNRERSDFSCFDANLKKDLISLFSQLGKGYKKEQLSLCKYTLSALNSNLETLKSEFSKKCKVYRSLSLFFGVCTVILLL